MLFHDSKKANAASLLHLIHEVQSARGRQHHRHFSIEGYRLIERCLGSSAPLQAVLLEERILQHPSPREQAILEQLQERRIPAHTATPEEMQTLIGDRTFGAMVGLVKELPPVALSLWEQTPAQPCKFLVVVDVKDPGNLGALMRTARASGVDAMLVVQGTDPFHPKAARTSMGAIFDVPLLSFSSGEDLLDILHRLHIQNIGAVVDTGTAPYCGVISHRHALWMGSEAHGLPQMWHSRFDLQWSIPMHADIDSFSINAATAILLYELNRRVWC